MNILTLSTDLFSEFDGATCGVKKAEKRTEISFERGHSESVPDSDVLVLQVSADVGDHSTDF